MAQQFASDDERSAQQFVQVVEDILAQNPDLGLDTRSAIAHLQRAFNIPADGVPGPQTLEYVAQLPENEIYRILDRRTHDAKESFQAQQKNQNLNESFSELDINNAKSEDDVLEVPAWFVEIAQKNNWGLSQSRQMSVPGLSATRPTHTRLTITISDTDINYFLNGISDLDPYLDPDMRRHLFSEFLPVKVDIELYALVPGGDMNDDFSRWAEKQSQLVIRLVESESNPNRYIAELAGRDTGVISIQGLGAIAGLNDVIVANWPDLVLNREQRARIDKAKSGGAGKTVKGKKKTAKKSTTKRTKEDEQDDIIDEAAAEADDLPLTHTIDNKLSGYISDDIELRKDQLGLEAEVKALCGIAASREVSPPLSIGLFGDWGSGKSFFIKEMKKCINAMAAAAKEAEQARLQADTEVREPVYWSNIVQVSFNAWHYEDADLWASLVVHIFDRLAEHVSISEDDEKSIEKKRKQLFAQIELIQKEAARCNAKLTETEQSLASAQHQVHVTELEYARVKQELGQLDVGKAIRRSFTLFMEQTPQLKQHLDDLGLKNTVDSTESLTKLASELTTEAGQLKAGIVPLLQQMKSAKGLAVLVVVLAAGIGGVNYGVDHLFTGVVADNIRTLLANISGVVATAGGYLLVVKQWLVPVKAKIKQVQGFYQEFDKLRLAGIKDEEEKITAARADQAAIEKQLKEERETRDQLLQQKHDLQNELDKIRAGRRLYSFIEEQATSDKYRGKLGIIASIREDFKRLSQLMVAQSTEKREAWKKAPDTDKIDRSNVADIDRIILYIDDLDRCTPEMVVEVLHAVHLLLAFKLFVVVVAVDSRWLINSLKTSISNLTSEIIDQQGLDEDNLEDDSLSTLNNLITTPQNYLEKIFQIPYTLPRMTPTGFDNIIRSLSEPVTITGTQQQNRQAAAAAGAEGMVTAALTGNQMKNVVGQNVPAPVIANTPPPSDPGKPAAGTVAAPVNQAAGPSPATPAVATVNNDVAQYEIDLNPEQSNITDYELQFMSQAYHGLRTPRSINRFVNTYRLIRSLVSKEQSSAYFKPDGEYRQVIILLIVLIGFNQVAEDFFVELVKTNSKKKLTDILTHMITRAGNNTRHRLGHLKEALDKVPGTDKLALDVFQRWVYPVSRYSFRPIRLELKENSHAEK
ncbi:MAG: P-loop NTPase fold protein [Gammaproteobacteria bacterium]|nr:P-loop NTPase fold protein [Gammaproteobacteria bacterium]